ncbi:MAG: hypothetical protein MRY83_05005, partial [Flavobacteriales bacterium]|nr:hypothetical protein [Flavobacteriales bacterium]
MNIIIGYNIHSRNNMISKVTWKLLCLLLISSMGFSQTVIKEFSHDSVKFYEEISTMLLEARKKDGKDLMKRFEPIWYGSKYSDEERTEIYKIANFMLEKRFDPFPEFGNYILSLIGFIEGNQPKESFEAWNENITKLMNSKNKRKFADYLKFCGDLFTKNAIYSSQTTEWISSSSNYQFEFSDKPFLVFPALTLRCYAKNDSSVIRNTSGIYYPTLKIWEGKGGVIDWQRAGFEPEKVNAQIQDYKIKVQSSTFECDTVIFTNSYWFDKPLKGKLVEKVLANVTPEKASYPQFRSFDKRLEILDIAENVDYEGGFFQKGAKFVASGNAESPASLTFYKDNKAFITAHAENFSIQPNRIVSANSRIAILLDKDSIVHPGLKLNFQTKEKTLSLIREEKGISKTPYFNSFHQVDMYFEEFRWKMDESYVTLGPLKGSVQSEAVFESKEYFKGDRYERMMGMDGTHPLTAIKACSRANDGLQELTISQLSKSMRLSPSQVKLLVIKLSTLGFVSYNSQKESFQIMEKLDHYNLSNSGKKDYDVINFISRTKGGNINARLSLLNYDMRIQGISMILLSDSQDVYIYPKNDEILLQKNRDFIFDGVLNAGGFEFVGSEYSFSYENFKVNMPRVDSARIYVRVGEKDDYGKQKESMVRSTIEDLRGELLIDNPGNKSGRKSLAKYPVFKSFDDSYVYYQRPWIFNNVYKRDNFYFHLEPFVFDSLDNFPIRSLLFKGSFASADIFPEFKETLSLMNDLSLGFSRLTPAEGFPTYKGKGKYMNEIILSNRGLRGDGTLEFLTATVESKDFLFFPDSMNTTAENFLLEEVMSGTQFPPVYGKGVYIHWEPYKDVMKIKDTDRPIAMFSESEFTGELTLEPQGLSGNGIVGFEKAEVESELIKFKFNEFDADTSEFRLKTESDDNTGDVLSFATNDVKAHVDFNEKKGEFIANGGGSFVEFPQNQYIAFMDKFVWYMKRDDIELSATTKVEDEEQGVQLEGSQFISVHEDQDSLQFYSKEAHYDVKKNVITAKKVQFIHVADALVYPDSQKVVIYKKAKMRTLVNSEIVANSITKYHKIYNATVSIAGRYDYTGSGSYDYVDENKNTQTIYFAEVKSDSTAQTLGIGTITEDQSFTLSPNYEYKGKAIIHASNEFLEFKGTGRILHNCETLSKSWFRFRGEIDPNDIYIPIDTIIKNDDDKRLAAGIMVKNDSAHIYPAFLSNKKRYSDKEVVKASGFLHFDKTSQNYKISNLAKLSEISLPGNYLSLNANNCNMYGEGLVDFGVDLGQIQHQTVGEVKYFPKDDSTVMDLVVLLDFFFDDA